MEESIYSMMGGTKWMPKEERLAVSIEKKSISIGVPKELYYQEKRVILVPSAVSLLVHCGHRVIIERGAGAKAHFSDLSYAEAGAELVDSPAQAFQADVVVKIVPPTLAEIGMMKDRAILISALYLQAQSKEFFTELVRKRINALSYEHIRDKTNSLPVIHSISEIVGNAAVLIGAEYLSNPDWGRGKMLGGFTGINPSEVIILGAGTVGEFAARAALGFGAMVKIFDDSLVKLSRVQNNLGGRVYTSIIQSDVLSNALKTADVVIGATYPKSERPGFVISDSMVKGMKKGAVIVDVSIDRGGCSETSRETNHDKPVYKIHDVTHYCVPNISARTPHTASYALSNFLGPFLSEMAEIGGLTKLLINNQGVRSGVYAYKGNIVNDYIAGCFSIPYYSLDLLLASF
ncbi:MAG: alanine dehydrogenase [Bacteroidales bacterium]|nr:alanine dehydrogenase [Bacteroidales bacterium]